MLRKKPEIIELTDEDISDYLFCPFKYYLKKISQSQAGITDEQLLKTISKIMHNTSSLAGKIFREALSIYASGKYSEMSLMDITRSVWYTWLRSQQKAPDDVVKAMMVYGDTRNQILKPFFSGDILTRRRKKYVEPRMSYRYKNEMRDGNMFTLAEKVDNGLFEIINYERSDLPDIGNYSVGDAYADSMIMAQRFPLIPVSSIQTTNEYKELVLESGRSLKYRVDIIYKEKGHKVLEVHDHDPSFAFQKSWVSRRLRVILGSHILQKEDAVGILVFRHLMSGENMVMRNLRRTRAILGVDYAINGIQGEIFYPAFMSDDLDRCRRCSAHHFCHSSGDITSWIMPGLVSRAEKIKLASHTLADQDLDVSTLEAISKVLDIYQILPTSIIRAEIERRRKSNE